MRPLRTGIIADPSTRHRTDEEPIRELGQGEILFQTLYLSLDPYMRGLMDPESDDPDYASPLPIGSGMPGFTTYHRPFNIEEPREGETLIRVSA